MSVTRSILSTTTPPVARTVFRVHFSGPDVAGDVPQLVVATSDATGTPCTPFSAGVGGSGSGWSAVVITLFNVGVLVPGTPYYITVAAVSVIGGVSKGAPTPAYPFPMVPSALPLDPALVNVRSVRSDATALAVNWTALLSSGGAPITGYTISWSYNTSSQPVGYTGSIPPSGSITTTTPTILSYTITGITSGAPYNVTVQSVTFRGSSLGLVSSLAIPQCDLSLLSCIPLAIPRALASPPATFSFRGHHTQWPRHGAL